MPTLTKCTGFYHGITNTNGGYWNGSGDSGGTASVSTSINRRTGGCSLDLNKSSGSSNSLYRYWTISGTLLVGRLYIYLQTMPSAGTVVIGALENVTAPHMEFKLSSAGALQAQFVGGTARTSATTVTTGVWYQIDFRINLSGSAALDWEVDGVAETQATHATAGTLSRFVFGNGTTSTTATWRINYTDVALSATTGDYPIGPGTCWALVPSAMGSHVNSGRFQEGDSTAIDASSYTFVDEWPTTQTAANTDFLKQITADAVGEDSYIELAPQSRPSDGGGAINGVMGVLAYTSATTSTNKGAALVRRTDGTEIGIWGTSGVTGNQVDYSDGSITNYFYKAALVTAPGGGWDTTELEALRWRIGYSQDVSPNPYWGSLLLEYDVADSAGPNNYEQPVGDATITPSGAAPKTTTKIESGGLTPAATLVKTTVKAGLAGAVSSIVGAMTPAHGFVQVVAGALTPAGALVKTTTTIAAGAMTPTATLITTTTKVLAGALTPAATLVKTTAKILAGALTPDATLVKTTTTLASGVLMPAGALPKAVTKILSGAVTPAATLSKTTMTVLSGAISSIVGAMAPSKTYLLILAGTVTLAGDLVTSVTKLAGGTVPLAGSLPKTVTTIASGAITPAATLIKSMTKGLAGALNPLGAVPKETVKLAAGSVASAGTLVKTTTTIASATVTSAGALLKTTGKVLSGAIAPAATLIKSVTKIGGGVIATAGDLALATGGQIVDVGNAIIGSAGAIVLSVTKIAGGSMTPAGSLPKAVTKLAGGTLAISGGLVTSVTKLLGGIVGLAGRLVVHVLGRTIPEATATVTIAPIATAPVTVPAPATASLIHQQADAIVAAVLGATATITEPERATATVILRTIDEVVA